VVANNTKHRYRQHVTPGEILEPVDEIARQFQPQRVILFGSYAYGTPADNSDVDLLAVMPCDTQEYRKATEISLAVGHRFPMDLLVRSPEILRQRLKWNDWFLKEVVEKGIVLCDAADTRMGEQGRGRLQQRFAATASSQDAES
jgi:uncharacterized protein